MCQRLQAQRSKKFRPRTIANREDEKAEKKGFEQRRDDEGPELAEQDSDHQGAGRGTDGEATDAQAAEYRTKRNRQKQENLRRMRYGLVYP